MDDISIKIKQLKMKQERMQKEKGFSPDAAEYAFISGQIAALLWVLKNYQLALKHLVIPD